MLQFEIKSENESEIVITELLALTATYKIILFSGNLGAGKTTFIKHFCAALGLEDTFSSPTFSIINTYSNRQTTVYHMDLYRINDTTELFDFGFEEYIDSGHLCLIEWPEIASPFIKGVPHLSIQIDVNSANNHRIITILKHEN